MKVVRIIARLNVGGPARHVVWLTAGLPKDEFDSVLVTGTVPRGEDDMSYFAEAMGLHPIVLPEMSREISLKDAITIWRLYRLLLQQRPVVVHTHTAKAGTVGRCAGLLYRWLSHSALRGRPRPCRFVHTYHGHIFHGYYSRMKTALFLSIERVLARVCTDKIIVLSKQQLQEINGRFRVGRHDQFVVVPLGLDLEVFSDWEKRRYFLRSELQAGAGEILIGIVGRLTAIKNHLLFLRAASLYRMRYQPDRTIKVRFVVIGDGELRSRLEEESRSLDLAGVVRFMGTRRDPENFYPALDVVALTSMNEGTPLTLIEAMGNARPVVATDVGGVADLLGTEVVDTHCRLDEGYSIRDRGILVKANDPECFARGLSFIVDNPRLRLEMGRRGRQYVKQHYSKERLVNDIRALYYELAR